MIPSCINENILSNVNVFEYQKHQFSLLDMLQ